MKSTAHLQRARILFDAVQPVRRPRRIRNDHDIIVILAAGEVIHGNFRVGKSFFKPRLNVSGSMSSLL